MNKSTRKRILITGGSGLLATNWALSMRDVSEITLGLHHRNTSIFGTHSKIVNLESVSELIQEFENLGCQIVINAAGLTNIEQCESNAALARHVNVNLASNVAQACSKLGIQLVHISTDHLFSGQEPLLTEE